MSITLKPAGREEAKILSDQGRQSLRLRFLKLGGERISPGVECRVLDGELHHGVLEPGLEGMNIDLASVSFSEGPVGCPFLAAEELMEDPRQRDGYSSVAFGLPDCFSFWDDPPRLEIDFVPLEVG